MYAGENTDCIHHFGNSLYTCSCGKRWLCTCIFFEVLLVLKLGKITGPTFMSIMYLPAHVYTLYPCAESHDSVYFPVFIHPSILSLLFRHGAVDLEEKERDRERNQLHSMGQGSDRETVRDPVQ